MPELNLRCIRKNLPILLATSIFVLLRHSTGFAVADFELACTLSWPMPFGSRILVPAIAQAIAVPLGVPCSALFPVLEFCLFFLACKGIERICRLCGNDTSDRTVATLFGVGLILLFHALSEFGPILPWDTAIVLFLVAAVVALFEQRIYALYLLAFLAALNKETAILVPLIAWNTLPRSGRGRRFIILLALTIVPRLMIYYFLWDNGGQWCWTKFPSALSQREEMLLIWNLQFLGTPSNFIRWNLQLLLMPILTVVLCSRTKSSGPLLPAALVAFLLALTFGMAKEGHVFAETYCLLFINNLILFAKCTQPSRLIKEPFGALPQ